MILRRKSCGSEAVEVGVTSLVIFALCIGVVAMFGDQLGKFFSGDASPIVRSAKMGKSSLTSGNATAGSGRTDIGQNLATGNDKAQLNLASAKSDIVETSGASGNLKGLTQSELEKQIAYYYNYDTKSGNDMLDAAIKAKKAAVSQYNEATKAATTANGISSKSTLLKNQVANQNVYLSEIQANTQNLISEYDKVIEHLELLKAMKQATNDINAQMAEALNNVNSTNMSIFNLTNANYSDGNSVLGLNMDQIAAFATYQNAQVAYDNGWVTDCDLFGGCNTYNDSGYTMGQINGYHSQYNALYSELQGRQAGLETAVDSAKEDYKKFHDSGVKCKDEADKLVGQAKEALKKAFNDSVDFNSCGSVEDIINKAVTLMGSGKALVTDKKVAYGAIDLLKSASWNYQSSEKYLAYAKQMDNNIKQKEEILDQLAVDSTNLNLEMKKYNTDAMNYVDQAQKSLITYADNPITFMANQVIIVNDAKQKSAASELEQKAIIDQLSTEVTNIEKTAADALAKAQALETTATSAVSTAQGLVDDVMKSLLGT